MRSRAAASVLEGEGFERVFNMEGGIRAWQGHVAEGPPDGGMAYFEGAVDSSELIGLALALEEGSRRFYAELAATLSDEDAKGLFDDLAKAEEHHKASLVRLLPDQEGAELPDTGDVMEGGMKVSEALSWAKGKDIRSILELSISLEANAYDLYVRMGRHVEKEEAKKAFRVLEEEERRHLDRLAALLEKRSG